MSTIRRGEQMKRALLKAYFLLAYRPSFFENFRALPRSRKSQLE